MDTVSVLFAARNSVYHSLDGVEVYDAKRDATTFDMSTPIVAHPPCRSWSAFTAHQAKPEPGEKELGLFAVDCLRKCGGILEHPAHTRLFDAAGIPHPGQPSRDGMWSLQVWQAWWGYPMKKATWLAFSGIDSSKVETPFRLHSMGADRRRQQLMSKNQRAATCLAFAQWLVNYSRTSEAPY